MPAQVLKIRQGKPGGGKGPLVGDEVSFTLSTGQDQVLFQPIGGEIHGDAEEGGRREVLPRMREKDAQEEVCERGSREQLGISSQEVLRQEVHGDGVREEAEEAGLIMDDGPLPRKEGVSTWPMREVRENWKNGCPSQERGLAGQPSRESYAHLQKLPLEGAQPEGGMQDMRKATERAGVLREALPAVQEVRGSDDDSLRAEAVGGDCGGYVVRRLTPV